MAKKEKQPKKPKQVKIKKPNMQKPEKEPKMRSSAPRRFGAWVLVVFMISMILFGVYKILRAPTEASIERTINTQLSNLDNDTLARTKAVAFAEQFVTDYYTYQQGEDYVRKMRPYCAQNLVMPTPEKKSQVLYVGTGKVEVEKDTVNVDVIARITYSTNDEGYDITQFATIRVPIKFDKKGNCAVVAPPIYVGNNNYALGSEAVLGTVDAETGKDIDAIKTTIKNFFEVYYKGKPSELKYYVTKNYGPAATTGLGINVTEVVSNVHSNGDKWDAECTIKIDNNGINQSQHCFLEIVKGAENRYYINKLYTIN